MAGFSDDITAQVGSSVAKIARSHGIQENTGQRWVRDYKKSKKLPFELARGRKQKSNKLNETTRIFLSQNLWMIVHCLLT